LVSIWNRLICIESV